MNKPTPSVKQMLEIGQGCGLETVEEAVFNYLGHYDCFFYIPEYKEQYTKFIDRLVELKFARREDKIVIEDLQITEALGVFS